MFGWTRGGWCAGPQLSPEVKQQGRYTLKSSERPEQKGSRPQLVLRMCECLCVRTKHMDPEHIAKTPAAKACPIAKTNSGPWKLSLWNHPSSSWPTFTLRQEAGSSLWVGGAHLRFLSMLQNLSNNLLIIIQRSEGRHVIGANSKCMSICEFT